MLSLPVVQEIKRLLDEGALAQRAIAERLGVSRGSVRAIAIGRRGLHGKETPLVDEQDAEPLRCSTCGALVYPPCVYCRAVDYARRRRRPGSPVGPAPPRSHDEGRFGRVA